MQRAGSADKTIRPHADPIRTPPDSGDPIKEGDGVPDHPTGGGLEDRDDNEALRPAAGRLAITRGCRSAIGHKAVKRHSLKGCPADREAACLAASRERSAHFPRHFWCA